MQSFLSAEVAQSVERRPEKPCVASSILALGTFFVPGLSNERELNFLA